MLPWDLFTMSKLEFYGKVNFLKGAITMADYITTVSRKYSQEIQTAEYGFGLEGVLRARAGTVTGIRERRGLRRMESRRATATSRRHTRPKTSAARQNAKRDLLKEFGLAEDTQLPVVGMVSRFVGAERAST